MIKESVMLLGFSGSPDSLLIKLIGFAARKSSLVHSKPSPVKKAQHGVSVRKSFWNGWTGSQPDEVSLIIQLDDYLDDRGKPRGRVLSLGPGLVILLPDSRGFRRPRKVTRLDTICGKCGEALRTWGMRRLVTDSTSPAVSFIECSCLIVAVEPARYDLQQIAVAWSSFRKLQNQVLTKLNQS
jgi:hypothetical protein